MSDAVSPTDDSARRARVAASNRSFGRVLSIAGGVLAGIALLLLLIGAGVYVWGAQAFSEGADRSDVDGPIGVAAVMMTFVTAILLLLALCALVLGEQMRRGALTRNPTPPDTLLPQASVVSQFGVLSFRWHLFWAVIALVIAAVLVGIPVLSWFTGTWPATLESSFDFTGFWVIYGSLSFSVGITTLVSLYKKQSYSADVRSGRATRAGGPGRGFWRWVDYRWRFDLWLAGLGGMLVALSVTPFFGKVGPNSYSEGVSAAVGEFTLFLVPGVALIALGMVFARQFWRAGESLGSGESVA
jgi:hypothetical protein